jgi:GDP-4-dehydro-6-deoxy-D-mannose reductase
MKPVIKVGNLEVRRDFGDVRDVVCAYVRLMERGRGGEVYNISTGRAVFLRKILDTLLSFSTCSIRVEIDPKKLRKIDLPLLRGNNRKIRQEVSWKPVIPLKKTLKDLLDYWRGQ